MIKNRFQTFRKEVKILIFKENQTYEKERVTQNKISIYCPLQKIITCVKCVENKG